MKHIVIQLFGKEYHIPQAKKLRDIIYSFSFSERLLFLLAGLLLTFSTVALLLNVNALLVEDVPVRGGSISEGIVGSPRFINPLLALSDADRDLTTLIYSGLMKARPDGTLVGDLAESYEISEDGRSYTFLIREDAVFHDNHPVTADDVIFTVNKAQDPQLRSPKRVNWEGVEVERLSTREVRFVLSEAYAPFLENTTLGILPEHVWHNADTERFPFSQFNTQPIGSGPYKIKGIERNSSGVPTSYTLVPFKHYALGEPFVKNINLYFYSNEDLLINAYKGGDVSRINSISPSKVADLLNGTDPQTVPLPRIFGMFFNQNEAPIFTDLTVRRALDAAIDKQALVDTVLYGHGTPINSPVPPGILPYENPTHEEVSEEISTSTPSFAEQALEMLIADGWSFNEDDGVLEQKTSKGIKQLRFSIATSNIPELKQAAEIVKDTWEGLGAKIDLKVFDPVDLNQNIIRPRKYEVLLFGEIIGRDLDFFAFWHSSQRNDPGLNIALYTNLTVDALLEEARTTQDRTERLDKYHEFELEVMSEVPAVFLYTPDFTYLSKVPVQNVGLGQITTPSDRFLTVHEWFVNTEKVWTLFNQ